MDTRSTCMAMRMALLFLQDGIKHILTFLSSDMELVDPLIPFISVTGSH